MFASDGGPATLAAGTDKTQTSSFLEIIIPTHWLSLLQADFYNSCLLSVFRFTSFGCFVLEVRMTLNCLVSGL